MILEISLAGVVIIFLLALLVGMIMGVSLARPRGPFS